MFFGEICYGIIYGMGAKSLGEQMGIKENDAACYIDSFKSRYTGKEVLSVNYLLDSILLNSVSILYILKLVLWNFLLTEVFIKHY